ncbi:MAG: filamentous hemagglutinin N-terminal domain-containing protein [Moorea sp. SIO1G6]|uniref:two-partner secretion domain-containing protein n=1 Tax=Moorena sp. SIO1G6 TaxID=2607840 RepID=UPI0013C1FDEC|nr:filamentous hemagglutinin N-terminal domain-containing protein [Moorena sp. SIO1G6]NET65540.1 filamentous hemagglutinin N-terminal domain-containing protein [Moorena sp. SIO1G6]
MKPPISRLVPATSLVLYSLLAATTALGQITPDNTLGNESSVVTPNVNVNGALADLIEGGAIRDSNLFHSFSDFNVAEFAGAYFANPAGVANILSRVTGGNVSNILGTLGVLGNANLFLINPNGIVFGPNSRLDVGGSFFGSTADSVLFEDGTVFSTKNPNQKPLLTINIPSGLQYGSNPGSITNHSSHDFGVRRNGLEVPDGQTLGLIGGDINIPGGGLRAIDGRIELGSVGANGVVKLTPRDSSFGLDYSAVNEFQDISLSEGALVDTSGEGGGSIQMQGGNVSLRDRSFIFADTNGSGSGGGIEVGASQFSLEGGSGITTDVFGSGQGGDLTVDATESVGVIGVSANGTFSFLAARVFPGVTGNGGDVSITTGQLIVSDGAFVSADTFGEGDGGNLTVNASSSAELSSGLFARTFGTGKARELNITTGQLIVKDGAQVSVSTFGEGDGGNLTVDADSIQLIGTSADGRVRSGLFAQANEDSTGNGGELNITTGQLMVSDGAQVSVGTSGEGDGGSLSVNASSIQLIGSSANGLFGSGLLALTEATGNAGNLSITTEQLIVKDGAFVSASTFDEGDSGNLTVDADSIQLIGTSADGRRVSGLFAQANRGATGNAGELNITTDKLMVSDGAVVLATTRDKGDGGKLTVDADSIQLIGTSADGRHVSGLFTETEGTGKGGDLNIATGQLMVSDGAFVSTRTSGEGYGGDLTVDADSIQLIGTSADAEFLSGLFTQTQGKGNAGDLKITTGHLIVEDGAQVSARTLGEGDGGNLIVDASSTVELIGTLGDDELISGLFTEAQGTGNAGEFLNITTDKLIISDGAVVSARSFEERTSAGEVKINANSIFLDNNARITAETAGGNDSNIRLEAGDIRLLNRSLILTDAENTTTGGNIFIDTDTLVGLGNSDITANAQQGRGGGVEINAKGIFGLEFRDRLTSDNDITSTSERGSSFNGEVILNISQIDPTSGLNELPGILVDAEAILANDLCGFENDRIAGGSSFTIIGKGGLPPTPEDPVINAHRTVRWRTRPRLPSTRKPLEAQANAFGHATGTVRPPQDKKVIIEAQGWVVAKDGTIILTAQPFNGTPVEQILPNLDCHSGRGNREQGTGNRE